MNKKGFVGDVGFIIGILFLISLVAVVGFKIMDSYNDKYQTLDVSNHSKEYIQETTTRYPLLFDGIFTVVLALLIILVFISVATIGTRPEFFFITLIMLVLFVGAGIIFSNAFEGITEGDLLNDSTSQFTVIPIVMDKLPLIALAVGSLLLVGLFAKIRGFI